MWTFVTIYIFLGKCLFFLNGYQQGLFYSLEHSVLWLVNIGSSSKLNSKKLHLVKMTINKFW